MSTAYSGQDGKVKTGSSPVDMDVESYDATVSASEVDVTTTSDEGWVDTEAWVKMVEGTFNFFINLAKSPFAAAQSLTPGEDAAIELYVSATQKLAGTGKILSVQVTSKTKDAIRGTCKFKSRGAWTLPTSS